MQYLKLSKVLPSFSSNLQKKTAYTDSSKSIQRYHTMGVCGSSLSNEERLAVEINREIEKQNLADQRADQKVVKLLLLGAGESGKSTIFKQMKILYGNEYTQDELKALTHVVYSNINWNLRQLLEAAEPLNVQIECKDIATEYLDQTEDETPVEGHVADMVRTLWEDKGVQELWGLRSEYQVLDCLSYYMGELDRITNKNYVPSVFDILTARVRTSGIVENHYKINGVDFAMFDVGGQRNERKKWIHCFDNVTAVIFVAAINEYDQKLFEDSKTNRIDEAVKLFDDICNNDWFKETSMILFLNKCDIFHEKLFIHPLRVPGVRHDSFKGPYANDPGVSKEEAIKAAEEYMRDLFTSVRADPRKEIYSHITCATDTKNVQIVFEACRDIILRANLNGSGFMDA